jgi:molybdopterin converting factor small subunit
VKIEVRLFATLAAYLPEDGDGRSATLEVPPGSTAAEVIRTLGIPEGTPFLVMVNGREAAPEHPLADGDVLSLFPPLAGGR